MGTSAPGKAVPLLTAEDKTFVFLLGTSVINQNTDVDQESGEVAFLDHAEDST